MSEHNNSRLRFGLVGCGRVSDQHFQALQNYSKDCELVAVCDIDQEQLEKAVQKTGAQGYTDYAAMMREARLDAVSICTPSGMHPEHGIMAARQKINVITEKPIATRLDQCDRLIAECEKQGVHLLVVKQNRLNQPVQLLKKAITEERFGQVYGIFINVFWRRLQSYYDQAEWRGTWDMDGGAFMNQAIHFIDIAQWLLGKVESTAAITATQKRKIEAEDSGAAILQFASGAVGTVNVSMLSEPRDREGSLLVMGEKGTVKIGGIALNQVELWEFTEPREEDKLVQDENYQPPTVYGFGHTAFYGNALDVFNSRAQPLADGREGRKSLELILAIYQSAAEGKTVCLSRTQEAASIPLT